MSERNAVIFQELSGEFFPYLSLIPHASCSSHAAIASDASVDLSVPSQCKSFKNSFWDVSDHCHEGTPETWEVDHIFLVFHGLVNAFPYGFGVCKKWVLWNMGSHGCVHKP